MKLSNLLQNPLNRKINRDKVAEIKRAIKVSGVIKPLVYTEIMTDKGKENMLTDGHHRYVALKEMGYKDAPVVMSDERGIETAQFQDMKTVQKLVTTLRHFLEKQARVAVRVAGNPARHGAVQKHPGQHDQQVHAPTQRGSFTSKPELIQEYGNEIATISGEGQFLRGNKRERQVLRSMRDDLKSGALKRPEYNELVQRLERTRKPKTYESKVTKHLQGQHDQSDHSPTGRSAIAREFNRKPKTRREATRRGAIKGGAVHLGTIAIPALATAAIIRGAAALRFGVIGAGVALVIYESPQLAFRIAEGAARERKEFERDRREQKVQKADAQSDKANRAIKRGDHLLVLYEGRANIGVYLGNDKARLVNGPKFEDVRTSKDNRLKIASGQGVPGTKDIDATKKILRQVKREQELINQVAQRTNKVTKRTVDKHGTHDQQDHDPTQGRRGKGKVSDEGKKLRAQLRPAFRSKGKLFAGKRGQIHADIAGENPEIISDLDRVSGFVDENNNFMTRSEALRRAGIDTSEELKEDDKKVTKHGSHNQQDHDPTKGRGQGALQQEARSRLRSSSSFKQLRRELQSLASNPNKPGNKERMDEIQQELAAQAREARGEVRQEPKPAITTISDVKTHLGRGTKVLLSAERSNLPSKQNAQRTAALREELKTIGSDVKESDSKYGGLREKGFSFSISPKKLSLVKRLMNKYKQESVIVIQDGKAELRYQDGRKEHADVSETTERVGADDNYSSIEGVKFTIPFKDRRKETQRKLAKSVNELREMLAKLNRLTKEGVASTAVSGLELTREDLQDEMAHPHPGRVKDKKKGWTTPGMPGLSLNQKMDMDEGVNTKHPYKNPDGAGIESARYP